MALEPQQLVWPILIIAAFVGMAFWLIARGKRPGDGPPREP